MATAVTRVLQHYDLPPAEVFRRLAEHENLTVVFPAKIARVCDGTTERNGVGSKRRIKPIGSPLSFEETVTRFEPDTLIEYTVTAGGGPLRHHLGTLVLTPAVTGGTELEYTIRWGSPVPGVAKLLDAILTRVLRRGLPQVANVG